MLVFITEAEYISDYKIEFNNNEEGVADLHNTIFNDERSIFEPLKDIGFFKNFSLDSWTIVWPNEVDFAPEFLYELIKPFKLETSI